jgi:hypothetical protein
MYCRAGGERLSGGHLKQLQIEIIRQAFAIVSPDISSVVSRVLFLRVM